MIKYYVKALFYLFYYYLQIFMKIRRELNFIKINYIFTVYLILRKL